LVRRDRLAVRSWSVINAGVGSDETQVLLSFLVCFTVKYSTNATEPKIYDAGTESTIMLLLLVNAIFIARF